MMNLREIKKSIRDLPPGQLMKLDAWLHGLISAAESEKQARGSLKARQTPHKTYRLERVRCGSKNCKCAGGILHGPYWYAYWTEGGKLKSQYIGKKLPKGARRKLSRHKVSDNLR